MAYDPYGKTWVVVFNYSLQEETHWPKYYPNAFITLATIGRAIGSSLGNKAGIAISHTNDVLIFKAYQGFPYKTPIAYTFTLSNTPTNKQVDELMGDVRDYLSVIIS